MSLCFASFLDTTGFQPRDPLLELPILLLQSSVPVIGLNHIQG